MAQDRTGGIEFGPLGVERGGRSGQGGLGGVELDDGPVVELGRGAKRGLLLGDLVRDRCDSGLVRSDLTGGGHGGGSRGGARTCGGRWSGAGERNRDEGQQSEHDEERGGGGGGGAKSPARADPDRMSPAN